MAIGDRMDSCTTEIQAFPVDQAPEQYEALNKALAGRRIVLVDTPGFGTGFGSDSVDVLERIVQWLEARSVRSCIYFPPVLNASSLLQLWEEKMYRGCDVSQRHILGTSDASD